MSVAVAGRGTQTTAAIRDKLAQRRTESQGRSPAQGQPAQGRDTQALARQSAEKTVRDLIERMKPEFARALPSHMSAERLTRIAVTEIRRNPLLLQCDQTSLLGALMLSAQLGLEPGPLGHCYLIPRKNKKLGRTEVHFMIGYRGYLDLLYRSDRVESVVAEIVYEEDKKHGGFDYQRGDNPRLFHKPYLDGPRGKPIGAYVVIRFKGGGSYSRYMTVDEIEDRRRRSASPDEGPWVTDWEAMARKTVLRDAIKWLPLSIEVQRAAAHDETTLDETGTPVVDAEFEILESEPEPGPADDERATEPAGTTDDKAAPPESAEPPATNPGEGPDSLPF